MRSRDQILETRAQVVVHTELGEIELAGLLVEQAQHDSFATPGRDRRYAHIDRAPRNAQADAAILRQAAFGDIEFGHDLDAADHRARDRLLRRQHFAQHAVDAETHDQAILVRFDMDVGCAFLDRFGEQRVDQANDRRVVLAFEQVFGFGQFVGDRLEVHALVEIGHHRARVVALLIEVAQQALEFGRRKRAEMQWRAEITTQFREHVGAHAGAAGDFRDAITPAGQGDAVATRETETRSRRTRCGTRCCARRSCHQCRGSACAGRIPGAAGLTMSGWPSSVGLARKSWTSGSTGRCARGVIGQSSWRICSCSVRM